jgi:hypothetical protein
VSWTTFKGSAAPGSSGECSHAAFRPAGRRFGAARAIGEGSGEVVFDERAHVIAALQVVTQSGAPTRSRSPGWPVDRLGFAGAEPDCSGW